MNGYTEEQLTRAADFGTIQAVIITPAREGRFLPTAAEAAELHLLTLFAAGLLLIGVPEFTLPDMRRAVEALTGVEQDPRNFARMAQTSGLLVDTGEVIRGKGRPAPVYRLKEEEELWP